MSIELPELYSEFNLEVALSTAKAQIPVKSAGLWTDVSDTDPGVVAVRIVLEAIGERLYSLSARTAPDALRVAFGQLLGVEPLGATRAVGDLELIVTPGTVIPTGYIVLNDETGLQYETTNPSSVTSVVGGALELPARAILAGSGGDIETPGQISRVLVQPGTGGVSSVSNKTAFTGGTDGETYDKYAARLPSEIQRDILEFGFELEAAATENASVKRARAFRATRPV
ncbi:MAG: hypothetical protein HC933_08160 [Pleurocapsa sp. SU_196_0]|nr:hypothetical protein [Pleurocapsa sp. SU_196_0]